MATSFDDYLSIVESGQTKTASFNNYADSGILAKLAEELEGGSAAPTAEGQVTPAASVIQAASPAVVGQTQAVEAPQLALAGASLEESAAGEMPAPTKPNQGVVISAGDGSAVDINSMGRTDSAAVLAARGDSVAPAAPMTEEEKTAAYLGEIMADSFLNGIVKEAEEGQYSEAVELLKEAGLLDSYDIVDEGMDKTAGQYDYDEELGLEKIANGEVLTREDMVKAASELIELAEYEAMEDEMAKEAEDYGRALAWEYAEELEKEAELEAYDEFEKEAELEGAYELGAEDAFEMAKEAEMVDALSEDQDVMAAVSVLKSRGLL